MCRRIASIDFVPGTFEDGGCGVQLGSTDEQIVGVERGNDEQTYLGAGEWGGEGCQDANLRQVERAVDFQGAPGCLREKVRGKALRGGDDGKFVPGASNGKEGAAAGGPRRDWCVRRESQDREEVRKDGKLETAGCLGHGAYSRLRTMPPSMARETPLT